MIENIFPYSVIFSFYKSFVNKLTLGKNFRKINHSVHLFFQQNKSSFFFCVEFIYFLEKRNSKNNIYISVSRSLVFQKKFLLSRNSNINFQSKIKCMQTSLRKMNCSFLLQSKNERMMSNVFCKLKSFCVNHFQMYVGNGFRKVWLKELTGFNISIFFYVYRKGK